MSIYDYCDGINRRDFIRVGALSASSFTLANYLKMADAGHVKDGHATSGIFIDLSGGPSHLDTFDPKPDAPEGIRGDFKTIPTSVAGVHISEQECTILGHGKGCWREIPNCTASGGQRGGHQHGTIDAEQSGVNVPGSGSKANVGN